MKMSGQRNKQLCGLVSLANIALMPGLRLIAGPDQKDVGWVTSATASDDRQIGLAYVKRGFNSAGNKVEAVSEGGHIAARVVDLPFAL
jgi:glycine cleavage system aminomethyltransferase T